MSCDVSAAHRRKRFSKMSPVREVATETAALSDADSSDSGCKLLSLEPDVSNGSSEDVPSSQYAKEFSLPNVLEALKSLSEEEVESRAQQLTIALQTDEHTLTRRMHIRYRQRDFAEKNLEREIDRMRLAIQSLQYLCIDCNSLEVLTEVRAQLDCVLASALSVSATAEAYGFVQCEERMAAAVAPLVNYVDNVANARSERPLPPSRSPFSSMDESRDDDRIMRRRSVAAVPLSQESRRRASIPSLPRPPSPLLKNFLPSQPPSPAFDSNSRRESTIRQRRDTRIPEAVQMADISESPESQSPANLQCVCVDPQKIELDAEGDATFTVHPVNNLYRSLLNLHTNYMEKLQFRWPDENDKLVAFIVTWYLLLLLFLLFGLGISLGRWIGAVT